MYVRRPIVPRPENDGVININVTETITFTKTQHRGQDPARPVILAGNI